MAFQILCIYIYMYIYACICSQPVLRCKLGASWLLGGLDVVPLQQRLQQNALQLERCRLINSSSSGVNAAVPRINKCVTILNSVRSFMQKGDWMLSPCSNGCNKTHCSSRDAASSTHHPRGLMPLCLGFINTGVEVSRLSPPVFCNPRHSGMNPRETPAGFD